MFTLQLNEDQKKVVEAIDGTWVVVAGPGSGKTATLIERYLNMIIRGIPQKDILNLTFTNAAATEMVKRVGLTNAEQVFRTFHSYALELLRNERRYVSFPMTDTIIPVRGEDYQLLFDLTKTYPRIPSFRVLQGRISEWKRANIEPEQAIRESEGMDYFISRAYEDYETICRKQGWLDFDSLMREAVKLLETNDEVRKRNQKRYISVDEAQDTDITQFRFLQLLYGGNILAVGDENQLIYEWRSAQPGSLSNFSEKFPGARTLYLGQNYRSSGKLVQFFKDILPVDNGIASHMITSNPEGSSPVFKKYWDTDREVRDVLTLASQDPENSAILARTNRQLFDVQRIAASKNIKYRNLGKKDFFDQNEVKALLHLAKDVSQFTPAAEGLREIIRKENLYNRYRNSGDPMNSDPIENMNNVVELASKKGMQMHEFLTYIRKLTYGRKSKKEKDLTLATVHQAKGREWKNVYIIGAEQGRMPHDSGEMAEEKRIFFVACSRAAENLQISWSGPRSMFLEEFEDQIQEISLDTERGDGLSLHQQQGNTLEETQLLSGE